jgi:hypothetical protein
MPSVMFDRSISNEEVEVKVVLYEDGDVWIFLREYVDPDNHVILIQATPETVKELKQAIKVAEEHMKE